MAHDVSGMRTLPIDDVLPPLRHALSSCASAVLQAPPGAGKTTRVPLALLGEPWLASQRVVLLEPRRLAARAAARWMASIVGEPVGATVGIRVRGETRVSRRTRLEVVTEGVLTRMLVEDPTLERVGLVIFDEFHERSLHADLGLALALETQQIVRPELRILVMSATLDGAAVSELLGGAPIVTSEGRAFPVDVRHRPPRGDQSVERAVASAVRHALANDEGSLLAFLPGAGEIRRTASLLGESTLPPDVHLRPLFGAMSPAQQDEAIAPPPHGRKVVLATSIAETSLTIEGVRIVIDGGFSRVPSFAPRTGMSRLRTVRVSRSAAAQRCGRAGRREPGVCYRLWSIEDEIGFLERDRPEIVDADLAPLALDLAIAGVSDAASLRWLDVPPAPALQQARELLGQLGAIATEHRVTPHGRAMARLGTHPRLAHMLLRGRELGIASTACVVAALLDERDVLRGEGGSADPDLRRRVALVYGSGASEPVARETLRAVRRQAERWRSALGVDSAAVADGSDVGVAVALAFPDRVAQRRPGSDDRYLLRNGLGVSLGRGSALTGSAHLAIAEVDGRRPLAGISIAAPLARTDFDRLFSDQVETETVVEWSDSADAVIAVRRERLGAIVLREMPHPSPSDADVAEALLGVLVSGERLALRWSVESSRLRARLAFLHRHLPGWPDVTDAALASSAREWLLPHLMGVRRREDADRLDLSAALLDRLDWRQRARVDELAPTHVEVPSGSRIRIDYEDPDAPVLAVRVQELFGSSTTPKVAGDAVTLTLHLLSPAHRPVQVTRDLAGFWQSSYFDVRRELRGRYPKHAWPDDPASATPTRRPRSQR
jgi:ATP-dependent helicase HrpB